MPPLHRLFSPLTRLHRWRGAGVEVVLRVRQWLAFAGLALAVLWYLVRPAPVAAMAAFALAALILTAYLWARQMALGVGGQRRLVYTALQVGDQLEEIVSLQNDSFLPVLYAELRDRSNFPDYTLSSVRAVDGNSSLEWRAYAICTRRGVFTLGPWDILTGDPFGIFIVKRSYDQRAEVLVYPPQAVLPPELLPRGLMQGDERPLHLPTAAESLNAVTTRPYQPGDPLRRLHWPTSARRDAPFIKIFQPEASSTLWLVPDLDAAVQVGAGAHSTLETTVMLLASLAAYLLKERMSVGLVTHDNHQVILPQRGQDHFWQLLRRLAAVQPTQGQPFAQTLAQTSSLLGGRDLLLAVTPSLSTDWIAPLHHINRGHQHRAEVILLDAETFAAPTLAPQPERNKGTASAFMFTLAELGIHARVLRQGDLAPISGQYGDLQRWEFITGGTGRAIARRVPRAARPSPTARWGQP